MPDSEEPFDGLRRTELCGAAASRVRQCGTSRAAMRPPGCAARLCADYSPTEVFTKPSSKLMLAWLPLQNGLLADAPQRQSVTRFRRS